jgi:hypothetical protein
MRFEPEEAVFRLPLPKHEPTRPVPEPTESTRRESVQQDRATSANFRHVVNAATSTGATQGYRWALSKRTGRPHQNDRWELYLEKGERIKVLGDRGNDWVLAENRLGLRGYAHLSWLDYKELRTHMDAGEAYARWTADVEKWLHCGEIRTFLSPSSYMNACAKKTCEPLKEEGVGICVHDLNDLLRGSEQYSTDFIRAQRNRYHPDKFARYCHPGNKEELKAKAEGLFVLFGVLMDWLENPPHSGNVD